MEGSSPFLTLQKDSWMIGGTVKDAGISIARLKCKIVSDVQSGKHKPQQHVALLAVCVSDGADLRWSFPSAPARSSWASCLPQWNRYGIPITNS
jgi:hypothetical protein